MKTSSILRFFQFFNPATIRGKVFLLGFAFTLIFLISNALVYFQNQKISNNRSYFEEVSLPADKHLSTIITGINQSSSLQRAYMVTKDEAYIGQRENLWTSEILPSLDKLKELRPQLGLTRDQERVEDLGSLLAQYQKAQKSVDQQLKDLLKRENSTGSSQGLAALSMDDLSDDMDLFSAMESISREENLTEEMSTLLESEINPLLNQVFAVANPLKASFQSDLMDRTSSIGRSMDDTNAGMATAFFTGLFFTILFTVYFNYGISKSIKRPVKQISTLSEGELADPIAVGKDELGEVILAGNRLTENLNRASQFALRIGEGKFDVPFQPASDKDVLGNALLEMKHKLQEVAEEEKRSNWSTKGLAKFMGILRDKDSDLQELSDAIISNLVKYIGANQGYLFFIDDEDEHRPYLDLVACYAYDRKKYLQKRIEKGEGLVGQAWIEKDTILLTEIPQDYVNITSGVGDARPGCILIMPLMVNEEIVGVIELASFKQIEEHEIEFIQRLSENIASTVAGVKTNAYTKQLLEASQQQGEELKAQEEEMRQNMEELQATQEEAARRERELEGQQNSLNRLALVCELDKQRNIIFANDTFLRLSGYGKEEVLNKKLAIIYHKNVDRETYDKLWKDVTETSSAVKAQLKFQNIREEDFHVELSLSPVMNEDNDLYKYVLVGFDITGQVKQQEEIHSQMEEVRAQEEELRQNMEELSATQEEMERTSSEMDAQIRAIDTTALLAEFEIDGTFRRANSNFCEVTKYTLEELTGKSQDILLPPGEKAESFKEKFWADLKEGKVKKGTYKRISSKGEDVYMDGSYIPVLNPAGEVYKILMMATDSTEERQLQLESKQQTEELRAQEEELRQNMEELQATQEEMARTSAEMDAQLKAIDTNNLLVEFDQDGKVLTTNKNFLESLDLKESETLGKSLKSLLASEEIKKESEIKIMKAFQEGRRIKGDFAWQSGNRDKAIVECSFIPVKNEDGDLVKIIMLGNDITERKELEAEAAHQMEELRAQEEELRQNMEELQATQEEASRNYRELEAQMKAINGTSLMAEFDADAKLIRANGLFLENLNWELEELIGKKLAYFAPKSGAMRKKMDSMLAAVIDGKVRKGDIILCGKGEIELEAYGSLSPVHNEEGQLVKIFLIASDNSEEAILKKEAQEKIQQYEKEIEKLRKQGKAGKMKEGSILSEVIVRHVLDETENAILSLDADMQIMAFNESFAKKAETIGLNLVKGDHLEKLTQGRNPMISPKQMKQLLSKRGFTEAIQENQKLVFKTVEGSKGEFLGATLIWKNELASTTKIIEVEKINEIVEGRNKELKILIVEDESLIAMRTRNLLKEAGFTETMICSSGEDAIILAKEFKPDLILMDYSLRGEMNGMDASLEIRKELDVPVVFISAFANSIEPEQKKQLKRSYYLDKPVNKSELLSVLDSVSTQN